MNDHLSMMEKNQEILHFPTLFRKLLIKILFSQRSPVTALIKGKFKHSHLKYGLDLEIGNVKTKPTTGFPEPY